jgi:hypothetical protein
MAARAEAAQAVLWCHETGLRTSADLVPSCLQAAAIEAAALGAVIDRLQAQIDELRDGQR